MEEREQREAQRVGDPDAGAVDPAADDPAAGMDVREFARPDDEERRSEAGFGGGEGALGGGGDLSGDFGGPGEEGDEGTPPR